MLGALFESLMMYSPTHHRCGKGKVELVAFAKASASNYTHHPLTQRFLHTPSLNSAVAPFQG
jgi:hypothetical protein